MQHAQSVSGGLRVLWYDLRMPRRPAIYKNGQNLAVFLILFLVLALAAFAGCIRSPAANGPPERTAIPPGGSPVPEVNTLASATALPLPGTTVTPSSRPPAFEEPGQTPVSNPGITPSPVPTPLPETLVQEADSALLNADWDRAISGYQSLIGQAEEAADADTLGAARLGLGMARLRSGDVTGAIAELSQFLELFPESDQAFEAEFLLGEAFRSQEDWKLAGQHYQRALDLRPGVLDSYIRERMGLARASDGDYAGAIAAFEAALVAPRSGEGLYLHEKIAEVHVLAGHNEVALEKYGFIYENTTSDFVRARMDILSGRALTQIGRAEEAFVRYKHAVENYPSAGDSYNALVALVDAGLEVNELARGLTNHYAGQYPAAVSSLDRFLSAFPEHDGIAHYYKALSLRSMDELGAAVAEFQELIITHPGDELWDDAWLELARTRWLWLDDLPGAVETYLEFTAAAPDDPRAPEALDLAARVAERNGDLAQAAALWTRIPAEYPAYAEASLSAFRAGIVLYRAGEYASAAARFEQSASLTGEPARLAAARLWVGKCAAAQGDLAQAHAAWEQAAQVDPTGYYSLRAEDLLAGRPPFVPASSYDFTMDIEAELAQAEGWLRDRFALPNPLPLSELDLALTRDPRLIQGAELWRLGEFASAKEEFGSLRRDLAGDPDALFRLTVLLHELGHYQAAILSARGVLNFAGMGNAASLDAPLYFSHIRFGAYYPDLVLPAARTTDLDPILLFAVIRQESLFEGFATSSAQARGLMQIVPATAAEIAEELSLLDYTPEDLYRPVVSVRFGAHYLGQQFEAFDSDTSAALAAYNGGPGNAAAWKRLAPEDPDLFLEVIRFAETQNYIRGIYEVFAIYRWLYGK